MNYFFDSTDCKIITQSQAYVVPRSIGQEIRKQPCFLMFDSGRVVSFFDLSNQHYPCDIENQIISVNSTLQVRKVINDLKKAYSEAGLQIPGLSLIFCRISLVGKSPVISHEHKFFT